MDPYLVPRDETARRIDPEGILDAPDSPGTEPQSPSKANQTSFSQESENGEGDLSGSDYEEEEDMSSAAKMIVENQSDQESSIARSVVKEDICTGSVTSLSFSPLSWLRWSFQQQRENHPLHPHPPGRHG